MIEFMPDRGAITLPVEEVRSWIDSDRGDISEQVSFEADFTVERIAESLRRRPSTVRGWLNSGCFEGAYKLNNREWRVPPTALAAFQQRQREAPACSASHRAPKKMSEWRR
jgi:hypothetical protein